jgi:EAL domain-containing protein (putative c-di-GMP-specific phosphodiesterase class I)
MAGKLGVPACADGIENVEDWAMMREMGCSLGQGPLVAPPLDAGEFIAWFRDSSQRLRECAAHRLSDAALPAAGTE